MRLRRSKSTFGTAGTGPYGKIDADLLAIFRIGASFEQGRYDLSLWVNNAFDKR